MNDYCYHRLTDSGVPLLKQLLEVFGNAFDETDTYLGNMPTDNYLRTLLQKDHFIVIVAQSGKTVIGGLAAYVLDKFEQERKEIYIYDLAVLKEHRRRGIATSLIQELKRIARESGAYVIFVQADKVDEAAIKLYEALGTREDVFQFDINVD